LPDEVPVFEVFAENQVGIAALMVKAGMATSNGEAGRLIAGGGVQRDGIKLADPKARWDLKTGESFVLKAGKKKFIKFVVK
jgi:tyrosyl-tRNA synthetase